MITDNVFLFSRFQERRNLGNMDFWTLVDHRHDLVQDIKSETSGNFRELLVALLSRPTEYYAQQLHKAVKGLGTDEKCIIEIMCSLNNQQIRSVREVYEELFKSSLEEDLVDDTSGYFRRLLRSLCTARRNETREIDVEKAKLDAERLHEAGELHLGTDEAVFNEILASRSYPQLLQIFTEYETLTGNTIEKAIENEFSGSIKGALLAIVQCARSKINFYAERLYKSMKGLGTDDKSLIRLVVTHCEVDMVEIKESFLSHYEETLEAFIEDDTSGNYRKALIALVKDEDD
ncbi:Annexin B9 [Gryllus bimaculatus]|nr:Annexin B9 [Gryllus bimaculatus]